MHDDMLAIADSVCLLASSRSDRHVLGLLLCAGLIALCCAVLCCACDLCSSRCSTTSALRSYIKKRFIKPKKKWEKKALLVKMNGKKGGGKARRQVLELKKVLFKWEL